MTKTRAVGGSRLPAVLRPAEDLPPAGPGAAGPVRPDLRMRLGERIGLGGRPGRRLLISVGIGGLRLTTAECPRVPARCRLVRPEPRPVLDRIGGRVDDLLERAPLLGREAREDVVDRVDAGLADAHPQSGESVAVEFLDDRLDAVVPARRTPLAEPEPPERQGA